MENNQNDNKKQRLIDKYEPFDVICLFFSISGVVIILVSSVFLEQTPQQTQLFEIGKYIIVGIFSSYVGKKWMSK